MYSSRRTAIDDPGRQRQTTVYLNSIPMHFLIVPMRVRGVARTQKEIREFQPIKGDVHQSLDEQAPFGRASNSAYILSTTPSGPPLPPLYEAVMTGMSTLGLTFTGIEIIDGVAYAQSWWCRVP